MSRRNKPLERQLLTTAELTNAIGSGFAAHVLHRLEEGDQLYGDAWMILTTPELLDKFREEAAHFGAWAARMIAASSTDRVDQDTQLEIVAQLNRVLGAAADTYGALYSALQTHHAAEQPKRRQ